MKNLQLRNYTAEFLMFTKQNKEKNYWSYSWWRNCVVKSKVMAELFDTTRNNITMHLKDIYDSKELYEKGTSKDFLLVQKEGQRKVSWNTKYYNLDAIIAVGFKVKVNSERAINFRLWAVNVLKQYAIKGYALDKERLKNGAFLNENYFNELL